ncbi:MAG: hypothetical protein O7H39_15490 [Gammaproteobacteria bacterium]|nr:hypothetical protein [Gammaproteobacteria bacterium]
MRDGIALARLGVPTVALVTEDFWPQGDFMSVSFGMPDAPRLQLPHPVAGSGEANLKRVAEEFAPKIIAALRGAA